MKEIQLQNLIKSLYDKLDDMQQKGLFNNSYIVLFAANSPADATIEYLTKKGIKVQAIVDNDTRKHGEIRPRAVKDGVKVYSPDEILGEFKENARILIAATHYIAMKEQLEKMGYKENIHIFQTIDFYGLKESFGLDSLKQLTFDEIRQVEFETMKYFAKFCEEHSLRYYLSGGTLLGAVRHKGFIPWDDDIDVMMPLKDYKRFIEIFQDTPKYKLYSLHNCKNYYWLFARLVNDNTILEELRYPLKGIMGVNIDIFPLAGFPEDETEQKKYTSQIDEFNRKWEKCCYNIGLGDSNELLRAENEAMEIMQRYDFDKSKYVGYIISGKYKKEVLSRKAFDNKLILEFEKEKFNAFTGYEEYLHNLYGDYMQLPPENERITHHIVQAYWKNTNKTK